MYDEYSVQIPEALPQQNPTPKPRSLKRAYELITTAHGHDRMQQRGYTPEQVLQTYVYGHEQPDPKAKPDVSHYVLNSIAHAQMRRRVVVDNAAGEIPTVYPREPIPQSTPTPAQPPKSTKAKQKAQKAKKRARSIGSLP